MGQNRMKFRYRMPFIQEMSPVTDKPLMYEDYLKANIKAVVNYAAVPIVLSVEDYYK